MSALDLIDQISVSDNFLRLTRYIQDNYGHSFLTATYAELKDAIDTIGLGREGPRVPRRSKRLRSALRPPPIRPTPIRPTPIRPTTTARASTADSDLERALALSQQSFEREQQRSFEEFERKRAQEERPPSPKKPKTIGGGWVLLSTKGGWKKTPDLVNGLYVRECGGGGDCLFHAIAYGVNHSSERKSRENLTFSDVRQYAAQGINANNAVQFLHHMMLDPTANRFKPTILQQKFERKEVPIPELVAAIKTIIEMPGFYYQGDEGSLNALTHEDTKTPVSDIGYVILRSTGQILCSVYGDDKPYLMILYNVGNYHWQLIGALKNSGGIQTVFRTLTGLPETVKALLRTHCPRYRNLG